MTTASQSEPHFDVQDGHGLLGLAVMPDHAVDSLRDKVQHQIEVHLVLLQ